MALTISIPSGIEKKGFFLHLLHTQSQKGTKFKNLKIEQHSSPHGYIVKPIKGVG
jgi:hypothetical protein